MPPAALAGPGEQAVEGGLGGHREADRLTHVQRRTVQLIEERDTGWARSLLQRQKRRFSGDGSWAIATVGAGEH
jgi:hypothetical protein